MLLAIFTLQFHSIQQVLEFLSLKNFNHFPISDPPSNILKKSAYHQHNHGNERRKKWGCKKILVTALFTYSHRVECHQIRRMCDIIWNFHGFYMLLFGFLLSQSYEFVWVSTFFAHDGNEPTSKQRTNTVIKRYVY